MPATASQDLIRGNVRTPPGQDITETSPRTMRDEVIQCASVPRQPPKTDADWHLLRVLPNARYRWMTDPLTAAAPGC